MKEVGETLKFLMSAAQWHNELTYSDPVFGTTTEYNQKYKDFHGHELLPVSVSAGASAVDYTTMTLYYPRSTVAL